MGIENADPLVKSLLVFLLLMSFVDRAHIGVVAVDADAMVIVGIAVLGVMVVVVVVAVMVRCGFCYCC